MKQLEDDLAQGAVDGLRASWPRGWSPPTTLRMRREQRLDRGFDYLIELEAAGEAPVRIAVETKRRLAPSQARQIAGRIRSSDADAVLVVSPWINAGTREVLEMAGLNYVDLTGNIYIALDHPRLAIRAQGANRDPEPQQPTVRGLRGQRSWILVRTLADVAPPYTVSDLASASGLSAALVSRVLSGLEEEGIVERLRRGPVVAVDVPRLIQRWSKDYALLASHETFTFVLPQGPRDFEKRLASLAAEPWAITGSLGAAQLAPIASPALGVAYVEQPREVAKQLGLLAADAGANVMLVRPFDPIVYRRRWTRGGIAYVAPVQLAVDCLTGTGRMPNEGDALLRWLRANEPRWRARSLTDERSFRAGDDDEA